MLKNHPKPSREWRGLVGVGNGGGGVCQAALSNGSAIKTLEAYISATKGAPGGCSVWRLESLRYVVFRFLSSMDMLVGRYPDKEPGAPSA